MHRHLLALALPLALALGCGGASPAPPARAAARGLVREGTPDSVNIALARAKGGQQGFTWEAWSPAAFERAKKERRFILLSGAAAWCHWCHVMDETTYHHPEIGRLLRDKFVTIRVDIDERPDIAERYAEWGWPATIILTPDAEELGKYRGYIPPEEMLPMLSSVGAAQAMKEIAADDPTTRGAAVEALPWIAGRAALDMDDFYDPEQGSWGRKLKSPIGANILFELRRAARGDKVALDRALFTLEKQRALIDPVWGGIYQYSVGPGWDDAHYEKLMVYQAANLEAYAYAHKATGRKDLLEDARRIAKYMDTFLTNPDGAFLVSQDADVGSHDEGQAFVDGEVYYKLGDKERRALGLPRIDDHVYAYENGLAIAAMCALFEASGDNEALARAERAAAIVMASHIEPDGAVKHDAKKSSAVRHLADAAGFGRALVLLFQATQKPVYRDAALRVADAMEKALADESGAYFAHTPDPAAAGVFARRERPLSYNALAARFLALLASATGDSAHVARARKALAAASSPREVSAQGRMLGEILLALDDAAAFPWAAPR